MCDFEPVGSRPRAARYPSLNAVILVGGTSRRMGRPKQILSRGGVTLAEVAVSAVAGFVNRVVLAGHGAVSANLEHLERLGDAPGIGGPLGGILAAMRRTPGSTWIVAACDMPLVRGEAVEWLLSHRRPDVWAILPRNSEDRVEPLFAVYEPPMKDILERRAEMGRFGFQKLAEMNEVLCPCPPEEIRDAWSNVNTMEEFESSPVLDV